MKSAEYGGKFPERKKKFNAFKEMNKSNGKRRNHQEKKDDEAQVKGEDGETKKRKHEDSDAPRKRGRGRGRGRGKGRNNE
ncbi:hypothetical protein NEOLI_000631 [Neolecta irregularis DAH-3]|uniref:Uncharacterized protein n=1 Tax=Neolecta irregularis (strain DAH-3) TaxID=1198029 RepID=A0A1U7LTX0_NEOID|nr:hypothetical protein NEOLI_000631 [Neolecta irregularis DAH-3]|eukprot:OLL26125.1 hypothetical protein NEOLI_000631 [Neolecta irregularis DAH-3]